MFKKLLLGLAILVGTAFGQTTTNLHLNLPPDNTQDWGTLLRQNYTILDGKLACYGTASVAGTINYYNGTSWLCLAGNASGTKVLQENASGVLSWVTVGAGTGDANTNASSSVVGEAVLFADTSGKLLKRSALSGIIKQSSGVESVAIDGVDYVSPAGNIATATALAANPVDCSTNQYANTIAANGGLTCSAVNFTQLAGSLALTQTPLTTAGDILYTNNTPALARLPKGTNGQVLTLSSGLPVWALVSAGGVAAAGADTQVQINDVGSFGANSGFIYNKTTHLVTSTGGYLAGGTNGGVDFPEGNESALTKAVGHGLLAEDFITHRLMACHNSASCTFNVIAEFQDNLSVFAPTTSDQLPLTDSEGTGPYARKISSNFVTPDIGDATGKSLHASGIGLTGWIGFISGPTVHGTDQWTIGITAPISVTTPYNFQLPAAAATGILHGVSTTISGIAYEVLTSSAVTSSDVDITIPGRTAVARAVNQTAATTATTLVTVGANTAQYHVMGSVYCFTAVSTATAALTITYTDPSNTAQSIAPTAAACTTLGASSFATVNSVISAKNATTIQYAVAIANSPHYDVRVQVYQLSSN